MSSKQYARLALASAGIILATGLTGTPSVSAAPAPATICSAVGGIHFAMSDSDWLCASPLMRSTLVERVLTRTRACDGELATWPGQFYYGPGERYVAVSCTH